MNASTSSLQVVHLGLSGFPYGYGAMHRLILLYKALLHAGATVQVINWKARYRPEDWADLRVEGTHDGISYRYLTGSAIRPKGLWKRNLEKIRGRFLEIKYLRHLKRSGKLDVALLYLSGEFGKLAYYRLLSRLIGFPLVINYVEDRTAFEGRKGLALRINDRWYDRFCARWCDAILPISDFLSEKVQKRAPGKPMLKVPVICDFEQFQAVRQPVVKRHFLYCGYASYHELIHFVLQAFAQVDAPDMMLHFVLGGPTGQIEAARAYATSLGLEDRIRIYPNVKHQHIPQHLANADALLIPMRPTIQDAARFPHKVGEYVAAGNVLISTAFGEIPHYFQDKENALLAADYDPASFAEKMQFVADHPEAARAMGQRGLNMGRQAFNYRTYAQPLYELCAALAEGRPYERADFPQAPSLDLTSQNLS